MLTICDHCGQQIGENCKHEPQVDGSGEPGCLVREVDTERPRGFTHRKQIRPHKPGIYPGDSGNKPARDMYAKKQ